MVNENTHYRWDFIGLSTDVKPTPATSNKVVNGSTYYTSDDSKLYVFCDGTWYERKALGGGGGGDTSDFTILSDSDANYTSGADSFIATWLLTTGTYRLADDATIGVLTCLDSNSDPLDVYYVDTQPIIFVQAGDAIDTLVVNSQGVNYALTDTTGLVTDTTYLNFTFEGATALNDGTKGLVPAPSTTDIDKFLKGDGTWGTPSGGGSGVNVLTSADYNYPENNPNRVALWKLNDGIYYIDSDNVSYARWDEDDTTGHVVIIVQKPTTSNDGCIVLFKNGYNYAIENIRTDGTGYTANNLATLVINNTNSSSATSALSAGQGKKLNDFITPTSDSGAPTTSTTGTLGKIYIDTSTDDAYMCVKVSSGTYTWKKLS